ncbi:Osmotin thaumatin-like protein [Stereum hirsutum FP-91666 SS1]|uniref:Osmotin thaumatin-like protein n=1 Tax=Stereum hirsutum (strain FP-91666) TaxID=721885 RepID=UPI00044493FB|nr:Osmotin thaumatin-like protein [Stereum hirsutum FP-91666 SS1]EIM81189.1 Osmotin thaumatin-like protein [Stereum hirsutum FP-91666 SS1]
MFPTLLSVIAAVAALVHAQSLNVVNSCPHPVFLYMQSSFGTIDNNVAVAAGQSANLHISSNWDGAVNVGTGCNAEGTACTTGGPTWDGRTPFSRAEFNWWAVPGIVTYDLSMFYGYNVGMKISAGNCDAFSCTMSSGCPVPGDSSLGYTCFSPCCSSAAACAGGALPLVGGGCVNNEGPGPHSPFYEDTCYNAYAFPDNDGANNSQRDFVVESCSTLDVTLTLCPSGPSSHYTS